MRPRLSQPKQFETEVCGTTSYMAPEVLKGRYMTECDMWSLGVMVYFMLSGSLPFKGRNDMEKEEKIAKGAVSFSAPVWEKVSEDGKDFVKQLLISDPTKRMSGKNVRRRPCARRGGGQGAGCCLPIRCSPSRLTFHRASGRASSGASCRASRRGPPPSHAAASDARVHVAQALKHPWIVKRSSRNDSLLNESTIKMLKQHAQQNRFQRAMRHKMAMHLTTEELHRLRNMFEGLDTDGTGTVSIEELTKAFEGSATDSAATEALKSLDLSSFDLDGDGEIDWREFVGGCVQDHDMYNEENLEKLFKEADTNQDGKLCLKEITNMLGDDHELKRELKEALTKARLADNDPTNDGKSIEEMFMTKDVRPSSPPLRGFLARGFPPPMPALRLSVPAARPPAVRRAAPS